MSKEDRRLKDIQDLEEAFRLFPEIIRQKEIAFRYKEEILKRFEPLSQQIFEAEKKIGKRASGKVISLPM